MATYIQLNAIVESNRFFFPSDNETIHTMFAAWISSFCQTPVRCPSVRSLCAHFSFLIFFFAQDRLKMDFRFILFAFLHFILFFCLLYLTFNANGGDDDCRNDAHPLFIISFVDFLFIFHIDVSISEY